MSLFKPDFNSFTVMEWVEYGKKLVIP